jgi:type II secretory pathway component PulF
MPRFRYQALDVNGQTVAGELDAIGVQQALAELQDRGLSVQSIGVEPKSISDASPTDAHAASTIKQNIQLGDGESVEQAVLRSHMTTILERGKPIAPALRAYAEEMPAGWQRRQLQSVCRVLERGNANEAATSLAELPECWIPLLSAATTSADPGHVLREFLTESQRTDDLRQRWWLTLAYPLILTGLAIAVMTALSIFVIPVFRAIFREFAMKLPMLTEIMLDVAKFMSTWGILFLVALGALLVLLLLKANRLLPATAFAWLGDRFWPPFSRRTAIARITRFTADLLEAGVSEADALRIAGFTVNQSRLQRAAWQLANDLELTGDSLLRSYDRPLTATVAYALALNIAPASRIRLLRDISNSQAERVLIGLSWKSGIVEPLAICAVGLVVAWTVLALFLPLISLIQALSK